MKDKHLVIYGVFDRAIGKCVMVGSTIHWPERIKGYKNYKWYSIEEHEHRVLWEGDIPDDEVFAAIRAVKEAAWIGRMKTWSAEGGHNQMNPVAWYLGNPNFYSDMSGEGNPTKRPEVRAKISAAHMGKTLSAEHRKNLGIAGTGRKHTKETKKKIGEWSRAKPVEYWDYMRCDGNPAKRPEVRQKISLSLEGRELSAESCAKISASRKGKATGDANGMRRPEVAIKFRKPKSEETKARMKDGWKDPERLAAASKRMSGNRNPAKAPEARAKMRKPKSEATKQAMKDGWTNRKRAKQPDFFDIWESQHLVKRKAA